MPVRRMQEAVAGDGERVRRPDVDMIKPLISEPSLSTNPR